MENIRRPARPLCNSALCRRTYDDLTAGLRHRLELAFEAIGRAGIRYVSKTAGLSVEAVLAHLHETYARDIATTSRT